MDLQKCMNRAMDYIEANLEDEINYDILSQFLNCSEYEFRRMFSFLAQISISEYIRNRRLSVAVDSIKYGGKIIDIAQQYGYDSQAAFSRAFKSLHGVTPSEARKKETKLNPYPQLTFKLVMMEGIAVENKDGKKVNIGGSEERCAVAVDMDTKTVLHTNQQFWNYIGNDVLGALSLPYYGAFVSEEKVKLLGDIANKKVLEIGCGTGRSLAYIAEKNPLELGVLTYHWISLKKPDIFYLRTD